MLIINGNDCKKVLIQKSYRTSIHRETREKKKVSPRPLNSICLYGISEINSPITHLPALCQNVLPEMDPDLASLDLVPPRIDALVGQDRDDDSDHAQYDEHQLQSDYIENGVRVQRSGVKGKMRFETDIQE
jgi:hypothetical protein